MYSIQLEIRARQAEKRNATAVIDPIQTVNAEVGTSEVSVPEYQNAFRQGVSDAVTWLNVATPPIYFDKGYSAFAYYSTKENAVYLNTAFVEQYRKLYLEFDHINAILGPTCAAYLFGVHETYHHYQFTNSPEAAHKLGVNMDSYLIKGRHNELPLEQPALEAESIMYHHLIDTGSFPNHVRQEDCLVKQAN